ncbi:hemolysin [Paracoccus alkanivorans]|uniref:Hemolysin n=1 Tax=Paracoccus alkanivorans TaxID=2116655 RepID=A0A3M0N2V8_9RHOB|nr:hemolysin [Paracoccus alkanivorans]
MRKEPPPPPRATCFTSGTLIDTDTGAKAVETLQVGDRVRTMDHGLQEIRWIGATRISATDLAVNPKLLPIRIKASALGQDLPQRDLLVSRQHRILVSSNIVQRMFGTSQILIPAISLVGIDGIEIVSDVDSVIYWHILFDRHEIIFAEETPTESLFIGPEALKSVPADSRKEIEALFPQLFDPDFAPSPARLIPAKVSQIRQLVARHTKHPMRPLSS